MAVFSEGQVKPDRYGDPETKAHSGSAKKIVQDGEYIKTFSSGWAEVFLFLFILFLFDFIGVCVSCHPASFNHPAYVATDD